MKIQPVQSPSFGALYYGVPVKDLSPIQRDVLDDINYYLEEKSIVKKLEDLQCDLYIGPGKSDYVMDVAVLKGVKQEPGKEISYNKIIILGGFANIMNKYKSTIGGLSKILSTDLLELKFDSFFNSYKKNYFKRAVNYVK